MDERVPPHLLDIEVKELCEELLDGNVEQSFVQSLLLLYPYARISLITGGSAGNTDTREEIACALSQFLLRCDWPTYGESVDIDAFTDLLKKQYDLFLREV